MCCLCSAHCKVRLTDGSAGKWMCSLFFQSAYFVDIERYTFNIRHFFLGKLKQNASYILQIWTNSHKNLFVNLTVHTKIYKKFAIDTNFYDALKAKKSTLFFFFLFVHQTDFFRLLCFHSQSINVWNYLSTNRSSEKKTNGEKKSPVKKCSTERNDLDLSCCLNSSHTWCMFQKKTTRSERRGKKNERSEIK